MDGHEGLLFVYEIVRGQVMKSMWAGKGGGAVTCRGCKGSGDCPRCKGDGIDPDSPLKKCRRCKGTGVCTGCNGSGVIVIPAAKK